MKNKVFVVKSYGGEWEDSWEIILGIYDNDTTAIRVADREHDKEVNWKNNLPIPYEVYQDVIENNKIPGFIEWEEGESEGHPFVDMEGYTDVEWYDTYNIVCSHEHSDYHFINVYEAILLEDDSTYFCNRDSELKCIYQIKK